jgi:hypothetical protein
MGTQQILLIVLSVIIVGIAVAVGITMFNQQAFNSNRNACLSDLNMFAAQSQAFYKTPESHGGAGSDVANVTVDALGEWIGFDFDAGTDQVFTGNGDFTLAFADSTLTITSLGNETGVTPSLTVNLTNGNIVTDIDGP